MICGWDLKSVAWQGLVGFCPKFEVLSLWFVVGFGRAVFGVWVSKAELGGWGFRFVVS